MGQIEIADATGKLHDLVERVLAGEEVVLTESGLERARLVAPHGADPLGTGSDGQVDQPVTLGRLAGRFRVPDDFDAPLPDELLDLFEGKP